MFAATASRLTAITALLFSGDLMHQLQHYWSDWRSSLWFIPSLIVLGAVALAVALIEMDTHIDPHLWGKFPRLFGAGAEGSRGMLATVAGSTITVAGVAFSITIVALSLTSSQYTSRVLRNFMGDRVNQTVLGVFVGVYAYSLVVLRTIRSGDEGAFVPPLAVFGGVVLAFVGIGCLIFFIHHIATAIQAANILAAVAAETTAAIERLFPEGFGENDAGTDNAAAPPVEVAWEPVSASGTGYIQGVNEDALLRIAREQQVVIRMECGIGDFVIEGIPLAAIAGTPKSVDDLGPDLNGAYALGSQRTIHQDAGFGFRQIVDVAMKALSPGVNDTTTAVMCIDRLTALLVHLARRRIPEAQRIEDGEIRVIAKGPTFAGLAAEAFDQIRQNAGGNVAVLGRLLWSLETIARQAGPAQQAHLRRHADAVAETASQTISTTVDRASILTMVESLTRVFEGPQCAVVSREKIGIAGHAGCTGVK